MFNEEQSACLQAAPYMASVFELFFIVFDEFKMLNSILLLA